MEALEKSIEKWQKIYDGTGFDAGVDDCELCIVFNDFLNCTDCPVFIRTGRNFCNGTPYKEWFKHHESKHNSCHPMRIECEECKRIAKDELDFLISLRKEE
jgi:hypothetical protein